jgi:hypothetical protein
LGYTASIPISRINRCTRFTVDHDALTPKWRLIVGCPKMDCKIQFVDLSHQFQVFLA